MSYMLKHCRSTTRHVAAFFLLLVMTFGAAVRTFSAGVTLITHGLDGDIEDWVSAMAKSIPQHPGYLGTNYTVYGMYVRAANGVLGPLATSVKKLAGGDPFDGRSGEIIIALDWSTLANGSHNSFEIAEAVAPRFVDVNFISDMRGHALAELPFHLIGHSRGGSLVCELSQLLGSNGIWVDHLTTLDPHPLNNDGFFDPIYFTVDAPARTYANVLFHDNYFQTLNVLAYGEPVEGAYVRELKSLGGGYGGLFASHSDVHLWYHGTIDLSVPGSDSVASITAEQRQSWWTAQEQSGVSAGFYYSRIARGDRLATNQPAGTGSGRIVDGFNQHWNFGAGTNTNRVPLAQNSLEWPNIIDIHVIGDSVVAQGETTSISAYLQPSHNSSTDAVLTVLLDDDFNPWNGNERVLKEIPLTRNPPYQIGFGTQDFLVDASNSAPGVHAILGRITGSGRSRYLYAKELLTIMSSDEPPLLTLTFGSTGVPRLDVDGRAGQRVVIEHSSDLQVWLPLGTNWLGNSQWSYADVAPRETRRFYRAVLQ